jgi:alkanesulfonate monooxygenase SsuD/methylene tetrahydromethanopterin reductase-like flavin-dependent oxidoreductase (luciferase family)
MAQALASQLLDCSAACRRLEGPGFVETPKPGLACQISVRSERVGASSTSTPIIVQAVGSGPGRDLAARTADLIFTAASSLEVAREFLEDMRTRAAAFGP